MADRAIFPLTVGVFGLAAQIDANGIVRILVNIRTDQERQWKLAKLEPIPGVQIVDCPGGGMIPEDQGNLRAALAREIGQETGGCEIKVVGEFSKPLAYLNPDLSKPSDMAVWAPIVIFREPQPSNEALDHPWISLAEFEAERPYRPVSGLGKAGRTGQMMRQALNFFHVNSHQPELFTRWMGE